MSCSTCRDEVENYRVLFVGSVNIARSPTAEALLKGIEGFKVKSAGAYLKKDFKSATGKQAYALSEELLVWSDIVFVMEARHRAEILNRFPDITRQIIVLDIPDVFPHGSPRLIAILKHKLPAYLGVEWKPRS